MLKRIASLIVVSSLVTGCTFPGLHYSTPASVSPSSAAEPATYTVERITPALLRSFASLASVQNVPRGNPTLAEAIGNYTYHVGPHDVLNIIVWNHPELTISQAQATPIGSLTGSLLFSPPSSQGNGFVVAADGTIHFPYAGTIRVTGETVAQIREQIASALHDYAKDAQVDVQVVGFRSETYQLAGTVVRPGLYSLTNVPITVSQALASAGGEVQTLPSASSGNVNDLASFPLADLSHVTLITNGKREVLDLRTFYLYGDQTQDRLITPGDIIQVPNTSDEQVYVIGEVGKQGNYPMSNGSLNLAQAIGEAGGLNPTTADPTRVFVFRGAYDNPHVYWLDARSMDAMLLASQFPLHAQDVVYVATTRLANWSRVIAEMVSTVQALYETKILVLGR